ncbi:MAG: hypothetical protein EZS28_019633, partial [Streblomastix strix]
DEQQRFAQIQAERMKREQAREENDLKLIEIAPKIRLNDLSRDTRLNKQFVSSLTAHSGQHHGIVDFVVNPTRFRVIIPKQNLILPLVLDGLRGPRAAGPSQDPEETHPYAVEAARLARLILMQRDVEVTIKRLDNSGRSWVGSLIFAGKDVAEILVDAGLAWINGTRVQIQQPVLNAQNVTVQNAVVSAASETDDQKVKVNETEQKEEVKPETKTAEQEEGEAKTGKKNKKKKQKPQKEKELEQKQTEKQNKPQFIITVPDFGHNQQEQKLLETQNRAALQRRGVWSLENPIMEIAVEQNLDEEQEFIENGEYGSQFENSRQKGGIISSSSTEEPKDDKTMQLCVVVDIINTGAVVLQFSKSVDEELNKRINTIMQLPKDDQHRQTYQVFRKDSLPELNTRVAVKIVQNEYSAAKSQEKVEELAKEVEKEKLDEQQQDKEKEKETEEKQGKNKNKKKGKKTESPTTWTRADVIKIDEFKGFIGLDLIDRQVYYDLPISKVTNELMVLDADLAAPGPTAECACLGYIRPIPDNAQINEEAEQNLKRKMIGNVFGCRREWTDHKQRLFVVLFDIPAAPSQQQQSSSSSSTAPTEEIKGSESQPININLDLVRLGYARYDDVDTPKYKRRELEEYIEAEKQAREAHKGAWLYGDFRSDKEAEIDERKQRRKRK